MTPTDRQSEIPSAGRPERVDVHCHCLPGIDDGPPDLAQALDLCRALVEDGVTTAIATPHQLGSYAGRNGAAAVRQAVATLQQVLTAEDIPLKIAPGGDVRVDPQLPAMLEADRVLTLGDTGRYVLVELPHDVLINLHPLIAALAARGVRPVVSHPERHRVLVRQPMHLLGWIERGALLQVTAGSLLGDFGDDASGAAWDWLGSGLVSLVASDAHDCRHRPPRMSAAFDAVAAELGRPVARRVFDENPRRVLRGDDVAVTVQRVRLAGRR